MPQAESHHTPDPSRRTVIDGEAPSTFDLDGALIDLQYSIKALSALIETFDQQDDRDMSVLEWMGDQVKDFMEKARQEFSAYHDAQRAYWPPVARGIN